MKISQNYAAFSEYMNFNLPNLYVLGSISKNLRFTASERNGSYKNLATIKSPTSLLVIVYTAKMHILIFSIYGGIQKYSRIRCLLFVKSLVICFNLGWSGSILQIRTNRIKAGSKSWLLTCSSKIALNLP